MAKTKLLQYTAKRRVRVMTEKGEQIVGEYFNIHYNAAVPPRHRMLRQELKDYEGGEGMRWDK